MRPRRRRRRPAASRGAHGPVVGPGRGRPRARPRRARHEGRGGRGAARAGRRCATTASTPRSCCWPSPPRRTAGSGTFAALERDAAFDACLIPEPTALRGRLRAGRRADVPRHRARPRRPRRDAARGPLRARPLRRRAPRAPGARARAQPRRRAPGDARARAALSGQRRAHRRRRVVELGARPRDGRGPPRRAARRRRSRTPAPRSRPRSTTASRRPSRSSGPAASSRPARPRPAHPWVRDRGRRGARRARRPARLTGVPYGADMRLFCARGIPTVMVGTPGLELAHAVDERVRDRRPRRAGEDHRAARCR